MKQVQTLTPGQIELRVVGVDLGQCLDVVGMQASQWATPLSRQELMDELNRHLETDGLMIQVVEKPKESTEQVAEQVEAPAEEKPKKKRGRPRKDAKDAKDAAEQVDVQGANQGETSSDEVITRGANNKETVATKIAEEKTQPKGVEAEYPDPADAKKVALELLLSMFNANFKRPDIIALPKKFGKAVANEIDADRGWELLTEARALEAEFNNAGAN